METKLKSHQTHCEQQNKHATRMLFPSYQIGTRLPGSST